MPLQLSYMTQALLGLPHRQTKPCKFLYAMQPHCFLMLSKSLKDLSSLGGSGNPLELFCVSLSLKALKSPNALLSQLRERRH